MASWSSRRQTAYFGVLILALLIVVAVPAFLLFYHPPTCTDGRQDGTELGVDCGGSCPVLCPSQAQAPVVIWSRAFQVSPGIYNAVAYVENPNLDSGASAVPYLFRLYDGSGVDIAERTGTATLPPGATEPIFEGTISTGQSIAVQTTFSFTAIPVWQKQSRLLSPISISNQKYSQSPLPRLEADLTNTSNSTLTAFPVVAILSDGSGNAISASETLTDPLLPGATQHVVFTWPSTFSSQPVQEDILPEPLLDLPQ